MSILRGGNLIVKVYEMMDNLSTFICEHSVICATPEQSTCILLCELFLSNFLLD